MSESISIDQKRAAIALADELDYARAAEQLNITSAELRRQISVLESLLCLRLFKPRQKKVETTEEGRFLIRFFREAVAFHERKEKERHTGPDR